MSVHCSRSAIAVLVAIGSAGPTLFAQPGAVSAPIGDEHYEVTVDSTTTSARHIDVAMTFTVLGPGPVVLSLPAWTPGSYEMSWFARWVWSFTPTSSDGRPLTWDKVDYETWRIDPAGAKSIRVAFTYEADTLDNAMAWTRPDFALFNGTNLYLYPEGRSLNFPATVTVHAPSTWRIATGMAPAPGSSDSFTAPTYHDLVDMPFFVGRFDIDSEQVADHWVRYASYPMGAVSDSRRAAVLRWLAQVIPPEAAVFGEIPWPSYTVMQITDSSYQGASGLEHQDSHVDVVGATFLDDPFMPGLYAHEIFHSWNVKRMRPADMVPYRYDVPQPTPWLWVSEGIADYYADLAQVRGGVVPDTGFYHVTAGKIDDVDAAPPTALTDASLTTWVHPTDGTDDLYYPKGSLAGFMLDILIRNASDNRESLDSVMRTVYNTTYKHQRGFSGVDWWGAASRAAGGASFAEFNRRYIDGREPFPWDSILPLAGLRLVPDSIREPRLGIISVPDTGGRIRVMQVEPGSAAAQAGVQPGDVLVSIGDIPVASLDFGQQFRARYGNGSQTPATIPVVIRRSGQSVTLRTPLEYRIRVEHRIVADPAAGDKARQIRDGIVHGTG